MRFLVPGLFVVCCCVRTEALETRPLQYTVSFEDAASHYLRVRMVVPVPAAGKVDLMMPVWTPGSYLIREYARHIDEISATRPDGQSVPIEKTLKNRWQIVSDPGSEVAVSYRLYCRELSVRSNWVDHDMAVLNGAATFLTIADAGKLAHRIRFELPDRWHRSITALPAVDGLEHTYLAESLDELIDSPVLCGNPVVEDFSVGGVPHAIANIGDSSLWDTAKASSDVQRIVAQQQEFWGLTPYSTYKFLNVIAETGGGLEHDNSTLIMTSRWSFRDDEKYQDWLSLVSHEFFHTWNVRRLRPAGLAHYNYETENNTRSLWISEGLTSYYEDLILVRAGLIKRPDYLKRLSKNIEKLQTSPGRNHQSLAESSFDSWIKFYRPDENASNSRISYYVKGCVVGFLLDGRLREVTGGNRSLDDVMRLLYQRHAGESGFTDADFVAVVNEIAGADQSAWLAQHVETTSELDYKPALDWFGLQFPSADAATEKKSDDPDSAEDAAKKDSKKPKAWLGIQASESGGSLTISGVTHGSPAQNAGLNVGDELMAFNQYRASGSTWQTQLTQLGVGQTIKVLISRRGEVRTLDVTIAAEPKEKWTLKAVSKPSDEQKLRITSWLGAEVGH